MDRIGRTLFDTLRTAFFAVPLLAGTLIVQGCTPKPEATLSEAREFHQRGETGAAIIKLKDLLQKHPDAREARFQLGLWYNETGQATTAEKELRRALNLGQDPQQVLPELGMALVGEGNFQQAIDEISADDGFSPEAIARIELTRGHALMGLGKLDDARVAFGAARERFPTQAMLGLAGIAVAERNLDAADALIEEARMTGPSNVDVWLMKGDLMRLRGNANEALVAYRKATEVAPGNLFPYVSRASLELTRGNDEAARKELAGARRIAASAPAVYVMQAQLHLRQRDYQRAESALHNVLKNDRNHMPSVLLLGTTHYLAGSYEQAEKTLDYYLQRNADSVYARKLLAAVILRRNDPQHVLDIIEPALNRLPDDPDLLLLTAEAFSQARQYGDAVDYLERAASAAPTSGSIRTQLGRARLAAGQGERAIADLESAARLDVGSSQADALLLLTYLNRKEYARALAQAAILIGKKPDDPLSHNLEGVVRAGMGDEPGARAAFEKSLALDAGYYPAAHNLSRLDIKAGKPEAAKQHLRRVLEKDKDSLGAMLAMADLAERGQDPADARRWLQRAAKAHPIALKPRLLLARMHLREGEIAQARILVAEAQQINANSAEVLEVKGLVQLAGNEKANAVQTFGALVQARYGSAQAHRYLAMAYSALGENLAAAESLRRALARKPGDPEIELELASVELRLGNEKAALDGALKAQKAHPELAAAHELEGDVHAARGEFAKATAAYDRALAIERKGELLAKLHQAKVQASHSWVSEDALLEWLKTHPGDQGVRLYLAGAYLRAGREEPAIEQYRKVVEKDPDNYIALNDLAWLLHRRGDPRAVDYAEQAYLANPNNGAVADTLGWIMVERGKHARGAEMLRDAARLSPDSAEIRYHLAYALAKAGDASAARKELDVLLASRKDFAQLAEARKLRSELGPEPPRRGGPVK